MMIKLNAGHDAVRLRAGNAQMMQYIAVDQKRLPGLKDLRAIGPDIFDLPGGNIGEFQHSMPMPGDRTIGIMVHGAFKNGVGNVRVLEFEQLLAVLVEFRGRKQR